MDRKIGPEYTRREMGKDTVSKERPADEGPRYVPAVSLPGKVFLPREGGSAKHPCPECYECQWCSDARCAACRGCGDCVGKRDGNGTKGSQG